MNRAKRMLEVLRDGQPHSRRELHERGGYYLTNNAASELRAKGYEVEQWRERVAGENVYVYKLGGSLSERGVDVAQGDVSSSSRSESEHEQLPLVAA